MTRPTPRSAPDHSLPALDDRRQSEAALAIQRGVQRLLFNLRFASITELPLANGRRADVIALGTKSEVWIIEIKSCLADFRADSKWPDYREFCDRLHFAVDADFPIEVLPEDTGLIIADRFGGDLIRAAPDHPLTAARRKSVVAKFAHAAADRLMRHRDPGFNGNR